MPSPERRRRCRPATLLATACALLLMTTSLRAEDVSVEDLLHQAKHRARIEGDVDSALELYARIVNTKGASPKIRGEAFREMARLHKEAGFLDKAKEIWTTVIADETLSAALLDWAKRERAAHRKADPGAGTKADQDRLMRERIRAEDARRVKTGLAAAQAALEEGRYVDARRHAWGVLSIDRDNAAAKLLLAQVEARSPDREDMLRQFLGVMGSQDVVEYDRVRTEVKRLRKAARVSFDHGDWNDADRLYRDALRRIDDSGFLGFGDSVDVHSIDDLRQHLTVWLRQTHERGRKAGLSFEPEPPQADFEARRGSFHSRALALLSDAMQAPQEGAERVHFFRFAPRLKSERKAGRSLSHNLVQGVSASHTTGSLTRARWAERWVRKHIGAGWATPGARGAGNPGRNRRLLVRMRNYLAAQCGESEQRRIAKLQGDFTDVPPAMRVDVQIFAVDAGGSVRAAQTLRLNAGPRESGLDHVIHNQLMAACVRDIGPLEGVEHLGGARLALDGLTSRLVAFTQLTSQHPAYIKFPSAPEEITVPASDARYGLWLDLYVEDMAGRRAGPNKTPTSALSLRARIKQPDPAVPSHIVPKQASGDLAFTRLPLFAERTIESDRAVPHFGTFLVMGLPNPFPGSRATHPELLVLIGTTREDTPTPDPPRTREPDSPIVPADVIVRDYPVGSLSIDIDDQMVPDAWPALRTAAEGVPPEDRRRLRDRNLASLLMNLAGIDQEGPGGRDAIVVQDHRATVTLGREGHVRVQQALQKLGTHANDLYEIEVRSGIVPPATWKEWVARPGYDRNSNGNYTVTAGVRAALLQEFDKLATQDSMFALPRQTLLARATQQRALIKLRTRSYTRDLAVRRLADDTMRYTPLGGAAEEGLVVEVRPMLEQDDGTRTVRLRARTARIRSIEARAYPQAVHAEAVYDVPQWHAGNRRTHSDARDAATLTNENAILIPLPLPGSDRDRVVVLVTVRRVQ